MILMTGRSFGEVVRTRIALDWHEPIRERPITVDIGGGWIGLRCSRVEMPAAPHGLADRQSPTADFACVSMPRCLGAVLSSSNAAPPEGASIFPWLKLDRRVWRTWWTDALAETCRDIGGLAQAGALEHFLWRRLITGTADAVTHAKWLTGRSSIVVQNAIAYTAVTSESYRRAHAEALRPLEETLAGLLPERAADRIGDASRPPIDPAIGSRRVPLQETQRLAADFYVNTALDASADLDQPLLWRSAHDRLVQYTGAMFLAATGCRPHGLPMLEARLYAGSRQPIVCSDKDSDDFSMARALVMPRLLLDQVEALRQLQQRWAAMSSNPGWRCWHAPPTRLPKARAQARTFMRAREPGICALDDSTGGSATAGGYTLRPRDLLTYTQMQRNGFRSALRTFLNDKGFFQYEIDAWMGHQVHGRDVAAPTATMPIRPVLQSMAKAVDEKLRALGWRVIPRRVG
ncbi:hypothetical protein SADO_06282 [Salinisphaera dokdonensis CL-ES53]|uniref:Uncharacterized protein n=2 Tax=Salinisphaera TaxID=180541 RepID=A0ABV2B0D3_9GAMM